MKTTNLFFLLILLSSISFAQAKLEKIWSSGKVFDTPESVIYDKANDVLYVSNISGAPWADDGIGFISKLGLDGKVIEKEWVKGISAPKGMGIIGNKLYVADVTSIVEIDIDKGEIVHVYEVEGAGKLNDIDVDSEKGIVYVSDSQTSWVHTLQNGKCSKLVKASEVSGINGLFLKGKHLFVGAGNIFKINLDNLEISVFVRKAGGVDGIEEIEDGTFVFTCWPGVVSIIKGNYRSELLNTVGVKNSADIEFIQKTKLLLIPTFSDNQIEAYRLILE